MCLVIRFNILVSAISGLNGTYTLHFRLIITYYLKLEQDYS
jgi:hypothetical protein